MGIMTDKFILGQLNDDKLEFILSMDQEQLDIYVDNLIQKYYPHLRQDVDHYETYEKIKEQYINSFYLEKIIRMSEPVQEGFIPVYTETGMIRELQNELYSFDRDPLENYN